MALLRTAAARLLRAGASAAAGSTSATGAAAACGGGGAWQRLSAAAGTAVLAADAMAVSAIAGAGAARPYWAAAAAAATRGTAARTQAAAVASLPAAARLGGQRHDTTAALPPHQPQHQPQLGPGGYHAAQHAPHPQQAMLDKHLVMDTLDTMKRLEALGLTRGQAEALTQHLTVVLCSNREKLEEFYASKVALEMSILEQEAKHAGFRSEVLKSQELQVATFTRDTERLQINLEKIRSEIRYEIDKLTASQRLDLNLEKGRMRDELQMLRDKSNELEIKMDKEVNSLKAAMEQSKNDTVKYVLGLMLALMTAGLGAARLIMN